MIDLSLRFKPISKLLLQKSHAAINYVRRYFKLSALTEPWLKLKQTTAGELYIKYEGNERGSRGSRVRKGKHSTHARRSTLRSLVRPLAPIFNTLQHAPLRSSKHSRSEIQRGSRDGSRNLHHTRREITTARESLWRHEILVSRGYTNMCRKTVQRRETLSRHLN